MLAQVDGAGAGDGQYFDVYLRDVSAIDRMMSQLAEAGSVDILVNNAGIQITTSLAQATAQIWDNVLAVNLAPFFTSCVMPCLKWPKTAMAA